MLTALLKEVEVESKVAGKVIRGDSNSNPPGKEMETRVATKAVSRNGHSNRTNGHSRANGEVVSRLEVVNVKMTVKGKERKMASHRMEPHLPLLKKLP